MDFTVSVFGGLFVLGFYRQCVWGFVCSWILPSVCLGVCLFLDFTVSMFGGLFIFLDFNVSVFGGLFIHYSWILTSVCLGVCLYIILGF